MKNELPLADIIKKYQEEVAKCKKNSPEFIFGGHWYDDDSDFRSVKKMIESRKKQDENK